MAANILRSIFFILLTAGLQYSGLHFRAVPGSEHGLPHIIFCYVLPFVLLAMAYWQWRKIDGFKKRAWMAENPAPFNPDLIDCYVRFKGKVTEKRTCRLPLSGGECVYYTALVATQWQVKKKKPAKGMETVHKPLFREQSADELELQGKDCRVYIKVEEFTKSCLGLHTKEKTQSHCPAAMTAKDQNKYKTYQLTERFILHSESVTVQGRLARNRNGCLFIRPTRRLEFPSFLVVQKKASQFIRDTVNKAWSDTWNRRIRVTFLLLNAGMLIYFWWLTG
jgi:hypothetical protein